MRAWIESEVTSFTSAHYCALQHFHLIKSAMFTPRVQNFIILISKCNVTGIYNVHDENKIDVHMLLKMQNSFSYYYSTS